jgi:hypothetical protein
MILNLKKRGNYMLSTLIFKSVRFCPQSVFLHSNKTTNYMQQPIVKFIALSYRHSSTCFGHYNAHHQELVKLLLQLLFSV